MVLRVDNPPASSGGGGGEAPTGAVMMYVAAAAPTDWLLCDGSAVSRTTYADLYAVIGDAYGAGDGSTTFNVPDFRDRVPFGDSSTTALGDTRGAATHQHTSDGSHDHGANVGAGGDHNHGGATGAAPTNNNRQSGANLNPQSEHTHTISASGTHQHSVTSGGGHQHNSVSNEQPSLVINFIIRT